MRGGVGGPRSSQRRRDEEPECRAWFDRRVPIGRSPTAARVVLAGVIIGLGRLRVTMHLSTVVVIAVVSDVSVQMHEARRRRVRGQRQAHKQDQGQSFHRRRDCGRLLFGKSRRSLDIDAVDSDRR